MGEIGGDGVQLCSGEEGAGDNEDNRSMAGVEMQLLFLNEEVMV